MYKKLSVNNISFFLQVNKHSNVLIYLFFFMLTGISGFSQSGKYPVKRIHAFEQEAVSGVNTGRDRPRDKKTYNWIYIELWPGKSVEVTDLWVNNVKTGFQPEKITSPVFYPESKENKAIIPKTSGDVLQLIKTELAEDENTLLRKIPTVYRHFPILIRYKSEGKTFYLGTYPQQMKKRRDK
jgi:hypothetical protein